MEHGFGPLLPGASISSSERVTRHSVDIEPPELRGTILAHRVPLKILAAVTNKTSGRNHSKGPRLLALIRCVWWRVQPDVPAEPELNLLLSFNLALPLIVVRVPRIVEESLKKNKKN